MELFRLVSYSTSHICLMCYVLVFTKRRYSVARTLGTAAGAAAFLVFLEWVRYAYFLQGVRVNWPLLVQILSVQAVTVYLSQYRDFRALFTGLTSSSYVLFGNLTARCLYSTGLGGALSTVAGAAINLLFLMALVRFLRPFYMDFQLVNFGEWKEFCLIPAAFYVSLLLLSGCLDGQNFLHNLAILSLLLTVYLTYVVVFRMIGDINEKNRVKKEREMLDNNTKALKYAAEEVHLAERRVAIQNHDRRHLIRTMQALMAKEDYDAVRRMLSQADSEKERPVGSHYCDNVPINGVVAYYEDLARHRQIRPHFSLDLPEKLAVDEWELAVVVGNLLENAILAAGEVKDAEGRELWMTARPVHGQTWIEVQNTYETPVEFDPDTGLPVSHRGEGHGLGLRSVTYFAGHCGGTFDCGIEKDRFFARLLF